MACNLFSFDLILRCIEIPSDHICLILVPYSYYTPDTLGYSDEVINEFEDVITQYDPFDSCRTFATALTCVYTFPACNPTTGRVVPICPELCPDIRSNIEECALGSPENYPSLNSLYDSFVCTDPQTYFMNVPLQYIENDTSNCSALGKYTVCILIRYR